ncbi:MAG: MBL fold metallo-hydrolase [Clostridia bacterium]|nr:MBL fold metallo-hydrolase [Clostridia bacterium]
MLIRYYGHSMFQLESAQGYRIVTDPFDPTVGYPMREIKAEAVTVSHGHFDHSYTASCPAAKVLDAAGDWSLAPGVCLRTVNSFHDEVQGQKRGPNLIFVYEVDGLRLCHLGDLGHELDAATLEAIGPVDLLMLPIGGTYTVDSQTAWKVAQALGPKVILPMHYKTRVNADWAIADPGEFKALAGEGRGPCPLLRVTQEDVGCCAPIVWMAWEA